jgi:DNA (cytosine-5)-methyltransferase 1
VVGLFAGIGGLERGFAAALGGRTHPTLLCESWEPARRVLAAHFPDVPLHPDVRELRDLPAGTDVVTAGFPCTDLSQAGRTAGIGGRQSGLVGHLFAALDRAGSRARRLPWLVIENVPNMLALDRGRAMHYLVGELERLGYRWAYRVVDARCTGLPQRRRRVLLVASPAEDPRAVLFADDAGERDGTELADEAFGFSWTEGRSGLGWARDAVPTLKGGSTLGIPSPPAVWVTGAAPGRRLVTPTVEDGEELQGFPRGWTAPAVAGAGSGRPAPAGGGPRWRLVGNAVCVPVAAWLAGRLAEPGAAAQLPTEDRAWDGAGRWPTAAWGESGRVWTAGVSEHPLRRPYRHLLDLLDAECAPALSHRAAAGFRSRLEQGNLGRHPGFREAVAEHVEHTRTGLAPSAVLAGP